jgi:hypothetical protein
MDGWKLGKRLARRRENLEHTHRVIEITLLKIQPETIDH